MSGVLETDRRLLRRVVGDEGRPRPRRRHHYVPLEPNQWVKLKFDVRANIEYERVFGDELGVRIYDKVASVGDLKT